MIRVLVADDHPVRPGRHSSTCSVPATDIDVVAQCEDGDQVVDESRRTSPDVVLLDMRMPRMPGLDAARALLSVEPEARIVVLTGSPSAATASEARALGAARRTCSRTCPPRSSPRTCGSSRPAAARWDAVAAAS